MGGYRLNRLYTLSSNEKLYLGESNPKICRFCGKSQPEVTFLKDAHAVSDFLGNKRLFTYYECDVCNAKFGLYENEFANQLKFYRGIRGISTKRRTHMRLSQGVRCIYKDRKLTMKISAGDLWTKNILLDPSRHQIYFKDEISFNPFLCYKALLKMGLSVLDDTEILPYAHLISFLKDKDNQCYTNHNFFTFILSDTIQEPKICIYKIDSKSGTFLPERLITLEVFQFVFCFYLLDSENNFNHNTEELLAGSFLPEPDKSVGWSFQDCTNNQTIRKMVVEQGRFESIEILEVKE